jgi:putative FmdB family regulatory protein
MPHNEFHCEKGKKPFEVTMSVSARERSKPECPACKGTAVAPRLGTFMAQTEEELRARGEIGDAS